MFISFDNGAHWQHFDQNMPNVPITDIKRHQKDLIVATQGRSIYIMDDVTPLTQITRADGVERRDAVQAARRDPRASRRWTRLRRRWSRRAAPGSRSSRSTARRSTTTSRRAPSTPVTIEILDANNKTIRSFSSEAPARAAQRMHPPPRPTTKRIRAVDAAAVRRRCVSRRTPGMNRLIWDFNDANGIMLPPGGYKVRLSANGKGDIQGLTLTMDPRLVANHVTAADLAAQYAHNVKMRDDGERDEPRRRPHSHGAHERRQVERREREGHPRSRRDDVRRRAKAFATVSRDCRRRSRISPERRRASISASGRMRSIAPPCCARSSTRSRRASRRCWARSRNSCHPERSEGPRPGAYGPRSFVAFRICVPENTPEQPAVG